MADIFSNMFFCNRLETESPRSSAPAPPRRQSMGGQDLSAYLKAYRNKETVDEDWKRVHEKGRGKKRFKKLVNKQIMVSKMQNLGAQKRRSSSAGAPADRFKPRGSLHESFLFSDLEKRRLAEISRENEEKKLKREEYLKQNKGVGDDRESLSSGQSRRRRKWKTKKDKNEFNEDAISDSSSIDLEASMRSLEIAFKIREPIDEMNEDSDEDDREKNGRTAEEEKDTEKDDDEDEEQEESSQAYDDEGISTIENDVLENNDTDNEDDNEQDSEEEEQQDNEKNKNDDEEEATPFQNKNEKPNRGINRDLIPPPNNLPIFTGKRRGSDKSTGSVGKNTPIKPTHRSPRSTRRVAPELTIPSLRVRSVSRDRSSSLGKPKLATPRASPRHFPASPNKTPMKTPKKDLNTPRKKSLTLPQDPFSSRSARKARAEQVKANPQANTVKRTGGAARSRLFDKSPSRGHLGARANAGNLQKSPARRAAKKPAGKGHGGNNDKKEDGVPMQNYGTLKF